MTRLFKKTRKKVGAPPGSLIYTGELVNLKPQILLFLYDEATCIEKHPETIDEALLLIQENLKENYKIWLHISSVNDSKIIQALGNRFKIHPLMLEDIMNPVQRSKLDDYKDQIYIVTKILRFINGDLKSLEDEQLSLVLGKNFLLSFLEKESDVFQPIIERLKKDGGPMRVRGSDYLTYAILDCIVDHYFLILEKVDNSLEILEEAVVSDPDPKTIAKIQKTKREMALLRKTIWPMREVINQFRRTDSPLITDATKVYAYDIYDHTIQVIETVESFRDVTSGMIDIYLSTINQRMNEVMKVLTIMATIFVPLTFVTSFYGMNFENMPELHHPWGYPIVLGVMFFITLLMLFWFRRKKWI